MGDEFATESAVLGDTFTRQLIKFIEDLEKAGGILKTISQANITPAMIAGESIRQTSKNMADFLKDRLHLSKIVNLK